MKSRIRHLCWSREELLKPCDFLSINYHQTGTRRLTTKQCMEQFKAVEKDLKTKAYSKEGLSAASRLDPKEKEKAECCDFLSNMVDELQQRIESMEAEEEVIQASLKKGKKDVTKANRLADISRVTERHKWHVNKLELLLRSLQNGNVEVSQVVDLKDSIKYYVEDGHNIDYSGEDETLYDDLNLGDDETAFGIGHDNDRVSSQDTQSLPDEEQEVRTKPKADSVSGRRPSTQLKSPLPVLATLHPATTSSTTSSPMKPAPLPTRLPGETLKYASAAAAAAASDRSGVGIAPLPPPPGSSPASSSAFPVSKAGSTYSQASPQYNWHLVLYQRLSRLKSRPGPNLQHLHKQQVLSLYQQHQICPYPQRGSMKRLLLKQHPLR